MILACGWGFYSQWLAISEQAEFEFKNKVLKPVTLRMSSNLFHKPVSIILALLTVFFIHSRLFLTVFSACPDLLTLGFFLFCPPDLIHCTNEMNVSIPHLADTLLERTASNSWIVVFKALITTHHLMMYGNEVSSDAQKGQTNNFSNSVFSQSGENSFSSGPSKLVRIWSKKQQNKLFKPFDSVGRANWKKNLNGQE